MANGKKTKRKAITSPSPIVVVAKRSTGNERNTVSSHCPLPEVDVVFK